MPVDVMRSTVGMTRRAHSSRHARLLRRREGGGGVMVTQRLLVRVVASRGRNIKLWRGEMMDPSYNGNYSVETNSISTVRLQ